MELCSQVEVYSQQFKVSLKAVKPLQFPSTLLCFLLFALPYFALIEKNKTFESIAL